MKRYEIYRLERDRGMTAADIAKKYGVSRQAVHQAVGRYDPRAFVMVRREQCVYPKWREWMNEHKVSKAELLRRMGFGGCASTNLSRYMRGKGYPNKEYIDRLIRATGLAYEQLFYRED